MRVAHVFNMANNAWNIVKALRDCNVSADLIIGSREYGFGSPLWEELEIDGDVYDPYQFDFKKLRDKFTMPEWLKIWWQDRYSVGNILRLFHLTEGYDLLHLHPPSAAIFQFRQKIKYVIHEAGWIEHVTQFDDTADKLGRRSFRNAECIVMTNPHHYQFLRHLKFKREVFIPFLIDPNKYAPMDIENDREELLFFHPTRHFWKFKRNDNLIIAFAKFISLGYKAKLRMVNLGWKEDLAASTGLISSLGIEKNVEWIEPVSKPILIRMYNESAAVFDQYGCGSGGTICYEAMSCGVPVVIYLQKEWNTKCFGEMPPIVNARSPDEIFCAMVKVAEDPSYRRQIGLKEREFVIRHNHPKVVTDQLINLYREILE